MSHGCTRHRKMLISFLKSSKGHEARRVLPSFIRTYLVLLCTCLALLPPRYRQRKKLRLIYNESMLSLLHTPVPLSILSCPLMPCLSYIQQAFPAVRSRCLCNSLFVLLFLSLVSTSKNVLLLSFKGAWIESYGKGPVTPPLVSKPSNDPKAGSQAWDNHQRVHKQRLTTEYQVQHSQGS